VRHKPVISKNAREKVIDRYDDGSKKSAYYFINRKKIGYRYWEEDGALFMEYGIKDGLKHGLFKTYHANGQILEEAHYVKGKEHGTERQYDKEGILIGSYQIIHGTGLDLWFWSRGLLGEERYCKEGHRHGPERWWKDRKNISKEGYYKLDIPHGIFRKWNEKTNKLRKGYPQYFVNGEKVIKRVYLGNCEMDSELPKFRENENKPYRKLPKEAGPFLSKRKSRK